MIIIIMHDYILRDIILHYYLKCIVYLYLFLWIILLLVYELYINIMYLYIFVYIEYIVSHKV